MATTTQLPANIPEFPLPEESQSQEVPQQEDLGAWNERIEPELRDVLTKLVSRYVDEFRYARRMEIMQDFKARCFWRDLQHMSWNWDSECWDIGGPAGGGSSTELFDSAMLYTTNTYQGFGKAFLAIITQAVPNLRFEPEDVEEAADIETSKAAETLRKMIQHENDPVQLMTKAAYFGWTCGRMHGWTRWEVNKRTKQPQVMQSVLGTLEVKVPIIYEEMCDYPYLIYSQDLHLSTVRSKVRARQFKDDYWKKIKGGSIGNGQDTYERTARISIMQGSTLITSGGDTYGSLVTTQRAWMRPTVFMDDCVTEEYRGKLEGLFPDGCYVEVDGGTYTGSRNANMDNEWTVRNIMEGDGAFRNGVGTCLISVQERSNDTINTFQDTVEKTQAATHLDDKLFDIDARRRQGSTPGQVYGVDMAALEAGDSLANHVYVEPPCEISPSIQAYQKEMMTDIPQSLTGLSSILWGADQGGDKSGKALSVQQSAAMGLIGLPFRVMKEFYAGMMEQAIRCAAQNMSEDWSMGVPDSQGDMEILAVEIGSLRGKVRCYADKDESYPETWMSKRATYLQLLQMAEADPTLKTILSNPENLNMAKRLIGLDEMTIPDEASWRKQLVEINQLLELPPPPPVPQPPKQIPNPMVPSIMEAIPQPPLQLSSIPIDPVYDNNTAEFLTVTIWVNSEKGQAAKKAKPLGFQNVRFHGIEHQKAIMAAMPPPPPPAPAGHHEGPPKPGGAKPPAGPPAPGAPPPA